MKRASTIVEVREIRDSERARGAVIGLVPTMGALHAGHLSLIARSKSRGDFVCASLFVNPLQFGPSEDYEAYPRMLETDAELAGIAGCDLLFHPRVEEIYPAGSPLTTVSVSEIGDPLEGRGRPGHFDGVATVVAKLLAIFEPDFAYFGQKDAQQLALVARMSADLSFRTEIVACPTIREADGLAISSRNAYLTADDRAAAPVIYRALLAGAEFVQDGERNPKLIAEKIQRVLASAPRLDVEYADVRDARTFAALDAVEGDVVLAAAVRLGATPAGAARPTRLIDNILLHVDGDHVDVQAGEIKGEP